MELCAFSQKAEHLDRRSISKSHWRLRFKGHERINPSTVKPYGAGPREAELGPSFALKLDAPGAVLRGLSGVSFRGYFSSFRSSPIGL